MNKPSHSIAGLRHAALNVVNMEACEHFYVDLLGMQVEWRPDPDNLYLTSGCDNLALHRASPDFQLNSPHQHLDHLGIILETPEAVDEWYVFLQAQQVVIKAAPKTHRDGARSFYCCDPDGNVVQMIYHPPIARVKP